MSEHQHIYYLTFGQISPLRRGYIEVRASNKDEATREVFRVFGQKWANIYAPTEFNFELFPAGKIGETLYGR